MHPSGPIKQFCSKCSCNNFFVRCLWSTFHIVLLVCGEWIPWEIWFTIRKLLLKCKCWYWELTFRRHPVTQGYAFCLCYWQDFCNALLIKCQTTHNLIYHYNYTHLTSLALYRNSECWLWCSNRSFYIEIISVFDLRAKI